ncbi:PfkB family carbohydrate kinase [Pengzhenrongella phosphoraccumulans]|uniref:PfkB family carbohydrate kinase n=1 Tax=Pengzhenrongella phosphoraccumulans TaxID=3114394 RepID=UPI003890A55D
MTARVAVVGSANLDIVLAVPRRPVAGETLTGTGLTETAGGKGLNQAIGAAKVAPCAFVGCVGRDLDAAELEAALIGAGVDTHHLERVALPTGRAFISLTPDGENSIIVLPLANHELDPDYVCHSLDELAPTAVLSQLEVPSSVTTAIAAWCARSDVRFMLNASPVSGLPQFVVELSDPLIVNAGEARAILGTLDVDDERALAASLAKLARSVVLTAGPRGAFIAQHDVVHHIEGIPATVRDTTGAGDAFAGTLAGHLAKGVELLDAAILANTEAARLVQIERCDR